MITWLRHDDAFGGECWQAELPGRDIVLKIRCIGLDLLRGWSCRVFDQRDYAVLAVFEGRGASSETIRDSAARLAETSVLPATPAPALPKDLETAAAFAALDEVLAKSAAIDSRCPRQEALLKMFGSAARIDELLEQPVPGERQRSVAQAEVPPPPPAPQPEQPLLV